MGPLTEHYYIAVTALDRGHAAADLRRGDLEIVADLTLDEPTASRRYCDVRIVLDTLTLLEGMLADQGRAPADVSLDVCMGDEETYDALTTDRPRSPLLRRMCGDLLKRLRPFRAVYLDYTHP